MVIFKIFESYSIKLLNITQIKDSIKTQIYLVFNKTAST